MFHHIVLLGTRVANVKLNYSRSGFSNVAKHFEELARFWKALKISETKTSGNKSHDVLKRRQSMGIAENFQEREEKGARPRNQMLKYQGKNLTKPSVGKRKYLKLRFS